MTTRQALHDLVDELPDDVLGEAEETLARLKAHALDPVIEVLRNAPVDDEPLTVEDVASIEAGWRSLLEGRAVSDEELDDELARRLRAG